MSWNPAWVVVALTAVASAASAAPATSEQANSIKSALERYVGHGDVGEPSPVSVTPEGDHYKITLDLKQALRGLSGLGIVIESATETMNATPLEGDTWRVSDTSTPRITVRYGEESYSVVANGVNFEGVFDPQIPGFQTSTLSYESLSVATVGPKAGTQTRELNRGKQTSTTTATGNGTADVRLTQTSEGFHQDVTLDPGAVGSGVSGTLSIKASNTTGSAAIDALHSAALAEVWAFLVAHPSTDALKASQAELRDVLRRALPVFDHLNQGGSTGGLAVESPLGSFTATSLGGAIKIPGLVADGELSAELRFDGLTIPGGLLPGWADGLVPTSATIKEGLSGFHLDGAARQAVDSFDLTAKDLVTPAVLASMKASLGPLDAMVLTLAPSHLASRLLSIDLDGDVRLRQPVPDFHVNVRAAGLDKALQDIQARSEGDPQAAQLISVLILAKGLGKAEPDGSLSWAVAKTETGPITVNGLALPGVAGK